MPLRRDKESEIESQRIEKYSRSMSSTEPGLMFLLIDQSASMKEKWGSIETNMTKAECLAMNVNRVLAELCLRNTKDVAGRPQVKPRLEVSILGYGCTVNKNTPSGKPEWRFSVESAFSGKLGSRSVVSLPEIASNYIRLQTFDGKDGQAVGRIPVWIEPKANGPTPMGLAFEKANEIVSEWVSRHQASFPPLILNFTDGEVNDVKPKKLQKIAEELKRISTNDGNVLLFNCHISSKQGPYCMLPSSVDECPDEGPARLMFEISSPFPPMMRSLAKARGFQNVNDMTRGFAYNVDVTNFVHFLQIGTVGLSGI